MSEMFNGLEANKFVYRNGGGIQFNKDYEGEYSKEDICQYLMQSSIFDDLSDGWSEVASQSIYESSYDME